MGTINAEPGDLLLQGRLTTGVCLHALMWLGGGKPFVHNVDKGSFVGVIRQENYAAELFVFRLKDRAVAAEAAKLAEKWAEAPGDIAALPKPTPARVVLKTPYSHQRMTDALMLDPSPPWSVDALFRVLKAIARANDGSGLSPTRGMSCSQFATYCYQAAALKIGMGSTVPAGLIGNLRVPQPGTSKVGMSDFVARNYAGDNPDVYWQEKAFHTQRKIFPSLRTEGEFIRHILSDQVDLARGHLPAALSTDAKFMTADRLMAAVRETDSGFVYQGTLIDNPASRNPSHVISTAP